MSKKDSLITNADNLVSEVATQVADIDGQVTGAASLASKMTVWSPMVSMVGAASFGGLCLKYFTCKLYQTSKTILLKIIYIENILLPNKLYIIYQYIVLKNCTFLKYDCTLTHF